MPRYDAIQSPFTVKAGLLGRFVGSRSEVLSEVPFVEMAYREEAPSVWSSLAVSALLRSCSARRSLDRIASASGLSLLQGAVAYLELVICETALDDESLDPGTHLAYGSLSVYGP